MFKKVAVLLGGWSAEREVSLKTGEAIYNALLRLGHEASKIDVDREIYRRLLEEQPDAAFIALHGRYGEDGTMQGLLELLEIPYPGSGVLASALAIDKVMTKKVFREENIPVAPDLVVEKKDAQSAAMVADEAESRLGLPVIVKPSREGSTIGVTIIDKKDKMPEALKLALSYDDTVLIEKFILGKLLTVALIGREPQALPIIEIRAKKGFYDYEAKYTAGMTDYICPAEISADLTRDIQKIAVRAHQVLGCEDVSRVDLMLGDDGEVYVLEVNTIPGMTETSLVPKAAAQTGINFENLIKIILEGARLKLKPSEELKS